MGKRVYVEGNGCNRRQLDVGKIRSYLELNGYALVDGPDKADKIVITTCAFKKEEEDNSVARLRVMKKYPADKLVFGCLPDIAASRYAEFADIPKIAPKEIETIDAHFDGIQVRFADMPDTNLIRGDRGSMLRALKRKVTSGEVFTPDFYRRAVAAGKKRLTNPGGYYYLFVCRGCAGKCSYCAIKRSVGTVKSKPVAEVLREFRDGVADGYRQFCILGDDPGCYGLDLNLSLPELFAALIEETGKLESSLEGPQAIGFHINEIHPKFLIGYEKELAKLLAAKPVKGVLCPLQSGNNRILELMQREHTREDFIRVVQAIRSHNAAVDLSTQIIVGFPTETEAEFEDSLNAVKEAAFDSVVVFPYDDKESTPSTRMRGKVPEEEIKRRMRKAFKYFRKEGIKAYYNCPD